jgi:hypothetical protein
MWRFFTLWSFKLGFFTLMTLSMTQTKTLRDVTDGIVHATGAWVIAIKSGLLFVKFRQILGLI